MAREKRSLFEWLTGAAGADNDYSFEDLESGGTGYAPRTAPAAPLERRSLAVETPRSEERRVGKEC